MYARLTMSFLHFRTLLFFSLMSYPGEIAYFNSPDRELSNDVQTRWCAEEKMHFTPFHILRQLKRYEALFPPLRIVVEFRPRYR